MKRILFPTDFSEVATNAFVHALEFAKIIDGEIILLHSFELPVFDNQFFPENYMVIYESLELSQFEMFKDEIPKLRAIAEERNLDHIKLTHKLMDGGVVHNIKKAVKEEKINFVVMGTAGASGWSEFFSGTNTGYVLSDIDIPLLSIPENAKFEKIEHIGFTTRFRPKDKKALKSVLEIAKLADADVKCLYVKTSKSDVPKETIEKWETKFKDEPIEFFVIESEDVKNTILDFIQYKEIDILTMLTYKRGFFESLLHPSLTKKVANNFDVPLLSIHIEE